MKSLPENLVQFIKNSTWIFSKTWPHEYIVQEQVDNALFVALAEHIDTYGYKDFFYTKEMT